VCVCELVWFCSRDQILQCFHRVPHNPLQRPLAALELTGVSPFPGPPQCRCHGTLWDFSYREAHAGHRGIKAADAPCAGLCCAVGAHISHQEQLSPFPRAAGCWSRAPARLGQALPCLQLVPTWGKGCLARGGGHGAGGSGGRPAAQG